MTEVAPGLAVTHHVGDLRRLAGDPPDHVRLFLGYAGWGAGQLVEEILRDDWLVAPVSEDLIFAADPDEVWELAVRSVGVDPATLPSWGSGGGEAN
jgi:putative transcriptional regulator